MVEDCGIADIWCDERETGFTIRTYNVMPYLVTAVKAPIGGVLYMDPSLDTETL